MKIYRDTEQCARQTETTILGNRDVLVGDEHRTYFPFFGETSETDIFQRKLHIHIADTSWSRFTGFLREYLLPWRWKTAYLDREDGTFPKKILVCASPWDDTLSRHLKSLLNKSLCVANLIHSNNYEEIYDQDYLCLPGTLRPRTTTFSHPLGAWYGRMTKINDTVQYCDVILDRGILSQIKMLFLKKFSNEWEEVWLRGGSHLQSALVKKVDLPILRNARLYHSREINS
jgi:hypothetical protein